MPTVNKSFVGADGTNVTTLHADLAYVAAANNPMAVASNVLAPSDASYSPRLVYPAGVSFGTSQVVTATLAGMAGGGKVRLVLESDGSTIDGLYADVGDGYTVIGVYLGGVDSGQLFADYGTWADGDTVTLAIAPDRSACVLRRNGVDITGGALTPANVPSGTRIAFGFFDAPNTVTARISAVSLTDGLPDAAAGGVIGGFWF